jgi:hypothetical protein
VAVRNLRAFGLESGSARHGFAGPQRNSGLIKNWFDKKQGSGAATPGPGLTGPRIPRYSSGWATLRKRLQAEPGLRVIDIGYTSPTNINYLTSLGHSVFMADLVTDACKGDWQEGTDDEGNPIWNVSRFIESTFNFGGRMFDVVLLWTTLDYLPEPFVTPVVEHLHSAMNPGGAVLSFFHMKTQGEGTSFCRFHLTEGDEVQMQMTESFPIQRAFTNRSIERLFAGWSGHRQFLAKDSLSEVIMTR